MEYWFAPATGRWLAWRRMQVLSERSEGSGDCHTRSKGHCKIAWMRVFLGWLHPCMQSERRPGKCPIMTALSSSSANSIPIIGVKNAKPMSEWGNQIFVEAVNKVAGELFTDCGTDQSKLGDRIESIFNISFWVKEQAIGWDWLGLEPDMEREADELVTALVTDASTQLSSRRSYGCHGHAQWH